MSRQNVVSLNASSSTLICCLLENSRRCTKPACARKVYTKRIEKFVIQKQLNVRPDPVAKHNNICLMHRRLLAPSVQQQQQRGGKLGGKYPSHDVNGNDDGASDFDDEATNHSNVSYPPATSSRRSNPSANQPGTSGQNQQTSNTNNNNSLTNFRLNSLPASTLRRYKKHFKLSAKPGLSKPQLADLVSDHFGCIEVDERKIVTYFIYSVKTRKNRLDQATKANNID